MFELVMTVLMFGLFVIWNMSDNLNLILKVVFLLLGVWGFAETLIAFDYIVKG